MSFEKKFPRQEAFENVICALRNTRCRIVYFLHGASGKVNFYLGICPSKNVAEEDKFQSEEYGEILERAFKGNFVGSNLESVPYEDLWGDIPESVCFKSILGVPSRNNDKEDISLQSIDRLVNIMIQPKNNDTREEHDFYLVVVWESIHTDDITTFRKEIENIYRDISEYAHFSLQKGFSSGTQEGESKQKSSSEGKSTSNTESRNESKSTGQTTSESHSETKGESDNTSKTEGTSASDSTATQEGKGTSQTKTVGTSMDREIKGGKQGGSDSDAKGTTTNHSETKTEGKSKSTSETTGKTTSNSKADSKSESKSSNSTLGIGSSKTESVTHSDQTGSSSSISKNLGRNLSITFDTKDLGFNDFMEYIDKELLPRIKRGCAKGMFKTSVYVGATTKLDCDLLANTLLSLAQGDRNISSPVYATDFDKKTNLPTKFGLGCYECKIDKTQELSLLLNSRPYLKNKIDFGTWLTAQEISLIAGFPQKDLPGLELKEQVQFGLNYKMNQADANDSLFLGTMMQEGNELNNCNVNLSRKELNKHIFIAGTTGSGKTTTCHRILASSAETKKSLPFLVIEPAKTEYRSLLKSNDPGVSDIIIFTVGNGNGVPFRFNPLEFLENETLSGHIDQLKAAFMSSFDMEAAIPNLLEQGLYRSYKLLGWDIETGDNLLLENRKDAFNYEISRGRFFPTLSMYIKVVIDLVNEKDFDDRLRDEYIGSIRARLESLTEGVKGAIFDTPLSVNFEELIEKNVIIELEDLKSSDDKSFIMALILSRLAEALKNRHKTTPDFKHITLIEEAHRLLSKFTPGDSPNRKQGVEIFADLLAEIRKYGESLIVVDQIPSKLTDDVLKNTNTKIIHKIFSRDDKDAVGNTMALDEKQREFLSRLNTGEAIVFSQGWLKPVDVKIKRIEDVETDEEEISDELVFEKGRKYWHDNRILFNAFYYGNITTPNENYNWDQFMHMSKQCKEIFMIILGNKELPFDYITMIKSSNNEEYVEILKNIFIDALFKYRCLNHDFIGTRAKNKYKEFMEKWQKNADSIISDLEKERTDLPNPIDTFKQYVL